MSSSVVVSDGPPTTSAPSTELVDGALIKSRLGRAERRNKLRAFLLVLPLLIFISVSFLAPIGTMMYRSFYNSLISTELPQTIAALESWQVETEELPSDAAFASLAMELQAAHAKHSLGKIATRLNYDQAGMRGMIMKSGKKLTRAAKKNGQPADLKKALLKAEKRWSKPKYWATIKHAGSAVTSAFYLKALDYRFAPSGDIIPEAESKQLYLLTGWNSVWVRTIWISGLVTVLCCLLGYPVAYLLANLPMRHSNLLMILVLLPFWTSLLVRTTAWYVVLQPEGVLNDFLFVFGLIDDRLQLIFNRFGVVVAMVHILLPFMILPIYSVMKTISPSYVRAARSLGATPFTAFWRVYFPQSLAGIGAGALLVFILALGYYITPALVGGPKDQLVSYFIAYHTTSSLNWSLACALGGILLVGVLSVYLLYDRVVGIDNMKLG